MVDITILDALKLSLIGFSIVFIVLILLMAIIFIMSKIIKLMSNLKNNTEENVEVTESAPHAAPAKGSCGDLTLVKVSERDAAMIMAIVADQLKTPVNELRFISIKEAE